MALEKKRKGETPKEDNRDKNEVEQAIPAKKPKLTSAHSMSEAKETLEHMDLGGGGTLVHGKGRKRKRKKGFYYEICQQMEFYFGDANMSKSKYMSEEISKSEGGWLNLDLFLRFNKLAEMMKTF